MRRGEGCMCPLINFHSPKPIPFAGYRYFGRGGGKPIFRIPGLDRFRRSDDIETLPIETILRLRLGRMEEIRNHRHASS